ncbi:PQQ-like domain-containing protein [Prosthecobacter debontii]|uniref:PQQ-like domain-containing protein n=1 Tax=Prosthecobacter debontii TaxID=48467 RepID=A0A1T4XZV8_9BACT|nr:Ig-like domain-containing protein [Prosthecobacter debontii]SKA95114.1 PQQ-like domain-containing protein [Prosthecobacter debontii]
MRRALRSLLFLTLILLAGWFAYRAWQQATPVSDAVVAAHPSLPLAKTEAPAVDGPRQQTPEPVNVITEAPKASTDLDLPSRSEKEAFLQNARRVEERATRPDEKGRYMRKRVVEADFKYPLLRIEEQWVKDPATGEETLQDQQIMVADHFLVTLKEGVTRESLDELLVSLSGKVRRHIPNSQTYLVEIGSAGLDAFELKLRDYRLQGAPMKIVEPDYVVFASLTPNDPSYSSLWGLNNTGQTGGVGDADIDAPEAWELSRGSANVVVGVVDTGIDYTHPDLAANMWTNTDEIPNNGVDDDANGYIDDVYGWDFVSNDKDPMDDHYHGTHCAGTIGAVGGNGIGVVGVCHTVKLMALKFLSSSGGGTTSDAIEAVLYATANQVTMTSNSWGGGGYSQTLKDAIDAAGVAGQLFVAAAGNDSRNTDTSPSYPAAYDSLNIISVAASDHSDGLASFTNYGAITVDLAAPGVSIYSTSPGNSYRSLNGTSMACPHVAGACALIKAARPGLSWQDVKSAVLNNVDSVAGMTGKVAVNGRMNLARALIIATEPYISLTSLQPSDSGQQGSTGNNDGILNPGEDIALSVSMKNAGGKLAQGLTSHVTVASTGNKVSVLAGTRNWGDVAVDSTVSTGNSPFIIRIAPDTVTPHTFSVVITSTDANNQSWTSQAQLTVQTTSTVSGRVTALTGGAGIGSATLTYTGTSSGSVTAGADGRYQLKLTDGTYEFRATAAGYNPSATTSVTLPPDRSNFNFSLGRSKIQVTPTTLASTQYEDAVATKTLRITNEGDTPLTYTLNSTPRENGASLQPAQAILMPPPVLSSSDEAAETHPHEFSRLTNIAAGSTGLPFLDGFESGSFSNWTQDSGTGTREVVTTTAASGSKSFHYRYDGTTSHYNGIHRDFVSGSKPQSISFWVRSGSTTTHDSYVVFTDNTYGMDVIWFYARGTGNFSVNGSSGGDESYSYQANVWYHIEFRNLDWTAKNFDYYVDGTLVKADIPFRNASYADELSQMWLYNFSTGSEAWWDDIRVLDKTLDWLKPSPLNGTLAPGASTDVTVTFDATNLLAGSYLGQVDLSSNDPANPTVSVPATMTVQALPNTPPVANAQTVTFDEDNQVVITLTGSDAENHALTAQIQTLPAQGTLYLTTDGVNRSTSITTVPTVITQADKKVIYEPAPNGNGTPYASFQFVMKDKRSQSTPATVTLNVRSVNDIPVAFNDYVSGLPGAVITPITVLSNDFDADGQSLTITSFTQPLRGAVTNNGDGTLAFTPNANFTSGEDSFSYTISDGAGGTASATVNVSVGLLAGGTWPMMGGNAAHTGYYAGSLNGQTLTEAWNLKISPQPLNQVSIGAGKVFATPNIYFNETQLSAVDLTTGTLIWKKVWDTQAFSITGPSYHEGAVYVQVGKGISVDNAKVWALNTADGSTRWSSPFSAQWEEYLPPTVTDSTVYVNGGSYGGMYGYDRTSGGQRFFNSNLDQFDQWTPGVLGDKVYSFVKGQFRQHASLTGVIEWTLDLTWDWDGYSMNRTMALDAATNNAFVVNNRAGPDELVCINLTTQSVRWRVQTGFIGTPSLLGGRVYAFDGSGNVKAYDITTGALLQTYTTGIGTSGLYQPIITQDVLIASSSTTTAIHQLSTGTKIQSLNAGGIPSLSNGQLLLAGTDGILRCFGVPVSGNTAPTTSNLTVTSLEDQGVTLTLPGTDANGDPLLGIITTLPAKGTLYQTSDGVQTGAAITFVPTILKNTSRKVIYRPEPEGFGSAYATFKYKVHDGYIASAEATATLNITNVNDAPLAVDDVAYLRAGQFLDFQPTSNDIDVDGEALQIVSFTQPPHGTVTQNGDGSLRYVPLSNFTEGTDTFQYTLRDAASLTSTATVQVHISATYGREWTQFGNDAAHSGRYPGSLGTAPWVQRWEYTFANTINPVVVAEGKVFVAQNGSQGGYLHTVALDASTGGEIWRKLLPSGSLHPPSYHKGVVYLQRGNHNTDTQLWALNAGDGSVKWNSPHGAQWDGYYSPAVSDLGVYINGGNYGGIYGFNHLTGIQKFFFDLAQYDEWTPSIWKGRVYSFVEGRLIQHHPETGVAEWTLDFGWDWSGWSMDRLVCMDDDRAYVVNNTEGGNELICATLAPAGIAWRVQAGFNGTPATANGIVYACAGGKVKAYNSVTGRWLSDFTAGSETSLQGVIVVTNDLLFVSSNTKTYIFNLATKSVVQTLNFSSQVSITDDLLYLACSDKKLRVYGRSTPNNKVPVALPSHASILEEAQIPIKLEGTDGDGETLSYVVRSLPAQGTLYQTTDGVTKGAAITTVPAQVLSSTGTVIYQAPLDVSGIGVGSFSFTAHDVVSSSAVTSVTLDVTPVNDLPVAVPDRLALVPGNLLTRFRPEYNDRDPDGDALVVVSFTQPAAGSVVQNSDGSLTYTPAPEFLTGIETFNYTIQDAAGGLACADVVITLSSTLGRQWPTFGAGPDHTGYQPVSLASSSPLTLKWTNTSVVNSHPVAVANRRVYCTTGTSVIALDTVTGGQLWNYGVTSGTTLNPPTWFNNGIYIQQGNHSSSRLHRIQDTTGQVVWTAPFQAQWESYLAPAADETGVFINGGYYGGMYGFSHTGSQLFFQSLAQVSGWTPTLYNGGLYSFVTGTFSSHHKTTGASLWALTYPSSSGTSAMGRTTACAEGHAFMVLNYSDATLGTTQQLISVNLSTQATAWKVSGKYTGTPAVAHQAVFVISEAKAVHAYDLGTGRFLGTYPLPGSDTGLTTQPIVTVDSVIAASSSKTYVFDLKTRALRQTIPAGGFISLAGNSLYIAGSTGVTAYSGSTPDNAPPIALSQSVSTPEDTRATVTLQAVDPDEEALTLSITALPAAGTLHQTADGTTLGQAITTTPTVVTHAQGKVIYSPPANAHGSPLETFQYSASDGKAISQAATATLHVTSVNDAPTARNDSFQAEPRQVLSPLAVLENDSDVDGDALEIIGISKPTRGNASFNPEGSLCYIAAHDFTSGTDTFNYVLRDAGGLTSVAKVTILIGPFVDDPFATDPAFSPPGGSFDAPVAVTLTAADPAAAIHYTLDGSAPHPASPSIVSGTTVTLRETTALRAISVKGSDVSSIRNATYTLADEDNDDLPDWWEREHFGSLTAASESTDHDLDGMSDAMEFFTDTDPHSALDTFTVKPTRVLSPDGEEMQLSWESKPGRRYIVETSSDLVHWTASETVQPLRGTGALMQHTLEAESQPRLFIRVRVVNELDGP